MLRCFVRQGGAGGSRLVVGADVTVSRHNIINDKICRHRHFLSKDVVKSNKQYVNKTTIINNNNSKRLKSSPILAPSRFSTKRSPSLSSSSASLFTSSYHGLLCVPIVGSMLVGYAYYHYNISVPSGVTATVQCEEAQMLVEPMTLASKVNDDNTKSQLWSKIKRALRIMQRLLKLMVAMAPIAALYPIQLLVTRRTDEDAQDVVLSSLQNQDVPAGPLGWYYKLCLHCIEWSGAAAIKIMQWAGSRPDMFGDAFCAVFSQLQDDTTPHAWKHTEKVLREAYGDDWEKHIRLDSILGSGCIAQVYKGVIFDENGNESEVAVKVMHPNVENDIDADLDIMRLGIHAMESLPGEFFRNLKWLDLPGIIDDMEVMLKTQLDLRREAEHLNRFNENFKDSDLVQFPELVKGYKPSKNLLVETFCEGVPVLEYIRNNTTDKKLLTSMCNKAIEAVCQMIFLDNFIHGDLHPGNVLISPEGQFVLLDVGIVTEHSEADHVVISDVLAAFIRKDGRKAGRRMIDDSNDRLRGVGDHALEEEKFIDKIEAIAIRATGKEYMMEHLGTYISEICNSAAQHHVMLNTAFISTALAVKVQEGIALALDPSVEIWRVATPIILEGERRRLTTDRAKELLGVDSFFDWFKSGKRKEETSAV